MSIRKVQPDSDYDEVSGVDFLTYYYSMTFKCWHVKLLLLLLRMNHSPSRFLVVQYGACFINVVTPGKNEEEICVSLNLIS